MISSTCWIPRGKSLQHPKKYNLDQDELQRVSTLANLHFDDAKAQLEEAQRMAREIKEGPQGDDWEDDDEDEQDENDDDDEEDEDADERMDQDEEDGSSSKQDKKKKKDPNDLSEYNLDDYDNEQSTGTQMGAFSNIKGLQFYSNNEEDPYITMKENEDEEDEEREELEVLPTDNLLVIGKTEDEVSQLEAYLYSNSSDSNERTFYVHHDLMLPSFPLCLEWLDYTPASFGGSADQNANANANGNGSDQIVKNGGEVGSFIAVGTMDPEIEIWDMNTVEGLFPATILGRKDLTQGLNAMSGTGKKKKKIPKARIPNSTHHVDAILSLSWNKSVRNLLASASADSTIKLWDLSRPSKGDASSCIRSFDLHSDKVQSVSWNTSGSARGSNPQPSVLLSGSYDKTVRVWDTRSPDQGVHVKTQVDVEECKWNPWKENNFLISLESGLLLSYDARMLPAFNSPSSNSSNLFTLSAHDSACTTFDISPHIPGCIATSSLDKTVKIWNVLDGDVNGMGLSSSNPKEKEISLVTSRDLDAGKIFSLTFSPDDPLTLAAAGSSGVVRIWDSLSNLGVRKTFGERLKNFMKRELDEKEVLKDELIVPEGEGDSDESDDEEAEIGVREDEQPEEVRMEE